MIPFFPTVHPRLSELCPKEGFMMVQSPSKPPRRQSILQQELASYYEKMKERKNGSGLPDGYVEVGTNASPTDEETQTVKM